MLETLANALVWIAMQIKYFANSFIFMILLQKFIFRGEKMSYEFSEMKKKRPSVFASRKNVA